MSTTIDQKVVEMRFDNRQFEKNVGTTMSTLDKLKQKLNLTGAAKGFDDIGRAAKKVDMTGLGRGVEQVGVKFNAMYTIADQALRNITTRVQHTAENMAKALTIDPIKTGFQEYETQINAVQTILANTSHNGTTIDQVNDALQLLNEYADKTIYNFTEMTRNIGTFTAAGVDLQTSVDSIQGIANLAAVSGSTSQQASTAMYQLSQALAAGRVSLMDWNSVVNAGMGGKVFQDALVRTSELLGTGAKGAIDMYGSFRESLTKGEWLTTEVLTETLKQFAGAYSEAELIEQGFTAQQAKDIAAMAKTAEEAATKVKTFTQLWDVLKESAQSGWSQTWKLLVGDYMQAKEILSPLADVLTGFINKMSEARNKVLESALGKSFKKLFENAKNLLDPIKKSADGIKEVVDSVKDYANIVDEVIGGKWGTGQERWDKLAKAGYDWAHAQNLVNEKLGSSVRHATNYKEAQNGVAKSQEEVTASTDDYILRLAKMTDEQFAAENLSEEQVKAFKDLAAAAEKTGIPLDEFIKNIDQIDGRYLMINGFKNAGDALLDTFKAIGEAWKNIFPPKSTEEKTQALFDILAAFHKFTRGMSEAIYVDGKFTETGNNLIRTLKGVFAILDVVTTLVGGGFKIAFKLVTGILSYFNLDILDLTANVGDAMVKFRDWVDSLFDVSKILDKIDLGKGAKAIGEWLDSLKNMEGVKSLVAALERLFNVFKSPKLGGIGDVFTKLAGALKKLTGIDLTPIGQFISEGLMKGLGGITKVIDFIAQLASDIINKFCDILGIHSPSKVFIAIGGFIIAGLISGITDGFTSVPDTFGELLTKCLEVFKNFPDTLKGFFGSIDWGTVFAVGALAGSIVFLYKIGSAFETFANAFENFSAPFGVFSTVSDSIAQLSKSMSTKLKTEALKNIAVSIGILVACVVAIVKICGDDYGKMWNAVAIVFVLAAILTALAVAMHFLSKSSLEIGKEGLKMDGIKSSLLAIAAAIGILALSVKLMGGMKQGEVIQGFLALAGVMGAVIAFVYILKKLDAGPDAQYVSGLGGLMIKIGLAMLLMVGVCKLAGKLSAKEMIKGGLFALAFTKFVKSLADSLKVGKSYGIAKMGGMLIGISIAMGLMVGVCKLASKLSVSEMVKGGIFALAFAGFVKLLVNSVPIVGGEERFAKLGGLLLSVSTSMIMMVGICKLVSLLSPSEMVKGGVFALAFIGLVGLLVKVTTIATDKQIAKVGAVLISMSLALGIMALISTLLSMLSVEQLAKGVTAVSVLGLVLAAMIKSIGNIDGAEHVAKSIFNMAIAIAVMSVAVAALSFVPIEKLAGATACLSVIMGMFALMTSAVGKLTGITKGSKVPGTLILMTVIVGILAGIVAGLSLLDPKRALPNTIALSSLMLAMAGVLTILSKMKGTAGSAIKSIGVLTAMVLPMMTFVEVLKRMDGIAGAEKNILILVGVMYAMTGLVAVLSLIGKLGLTSSLMGIIGLTAMVVPMMAFAMVLEGLREFNLAEAKGNILLLVGVMTAMTLLLGILTVIGFGAVASLAGIIALTAMVVPMLTFTWMLQKLTGVEFATENIMLLLDMMGVMTDLITKLADAGLSALVGVGALQALILLIGELAIFATAIGGIMDLCPWLEKWLHKGLPLLEDISASMGRMIGSFIGNIGEALGDSLVEIGKDITAFMESMKAASDVAGTIDGSSIDGFEKFMTGLSKCLLGVGGTSVATSITDIWTNILGGKGDQDSMSKFAEDGVAFFEAMDEISSAAEDVEFPKNFDPDALVKFIEAIGSISKMSIGSSIADIWVNILGGKGSQDSMSKFVEDGKAFFAAIKEISKEMAGAELPDDYNLEGLEKLLEILKTVSTDMAGTSLADVFTKMFSDGQTGMDKFAKDGVAFFKAVKEIAAEAADAKLSNNFKLGGLETLLESLKTVGETMGDVSLSDLFAKVAGDEGSMEKFQNDGVTFFKAIKAISAEMEGISLSDNLPSKENLSSLFELLKSVGGYTSDQGWSDFLTRGGTTIEKFKSDAVGLFTALSTVSTEASKVQLGNFDTVRSAIAKVKQLFAEVAGIEYDSSAIANFTGIGFGQGGFGADGPMNRIATALSKFSTDAALIQLGTFDTVRGAVGRAKQIIAELIGIDYSGVQAFTGVGDGWFGADGPMNDIAKAVSKFSTDASTIDLTYFDTVRSAVGRSKQIIADLVGIDYTGVLPFTGVGDGWLGADGPLNDIAKALSKFSTDAAMVDSTCFATVKSAVSTSKSIIASLVGIDYSGVEEFTGIGTGGFGADGPLYDIGRAMSKYGEAVAGLDTATIQSSITSAGRLKSLINSLVGLDSSGIEEFKAKKIGTAIKDYSNQVDSINISAISSSISAANRLKNFISGLAGLNNSGVALFNPTPIGLKLKAYAVNVATVNVGVINNSINAANKLKNFIASLAGLNTSGVSSFKSAVENLGRIQIGNIEKTFRSAAANLTTIGGQLIDGISKGMRSKQGALMNTSMSITKALVADARKPMDTFRTIGVAYMSKLANGISSHRRAAVTALTSAISTSISSARGHYTSFYNAGSYLVSGFANGISANAYKATARAIAMALAAKNAAEAALGIASPSKVFYKIGDYAGQGLVNALGDYNSKTYEAGSTMAEYAKRGLSNALSQIQDTIDSDLDTQPTIRPVLDLTNVRSGAAAIGGLFGNGVSVGTLASVNSIGSMMNSRIQNGSNDDVISAIDRLGASLANASGDTYMIDGVTYDDGSNISNAMREIVREARIERRR